MENFINKEIKILQKRKAKEFRHAVLHVFLAIFIVVSMIVSLKQNDKKIELQKVIIKNQIDLSQKVNKLWENLK